MTIWNSAQTRPSLGDHMVDIWRASLEIDSRQLPALQAHLSAPDQERAALFHFERDRRRYVTAHAALRGILGRYLDCPPREISFQINPYGKPALGQAAGLHFNLAHSHEIALVAVTRLGEIGVDLEHVRPLDDLEALAYRTFSAAEYHRLQTLTGAMRQRAFFDCWARKESYIKALGEGLSHALQDFSVSLLPGEPARLLDVRGNPGEASRWTLQAIELSEAYAAAFAIRATSVGLRCWNWNLQSELAYVETR